MSEDAYGMADAVLELESELAHVVDCAAGSLSCVYGTRQETKSLGFGGYALQSDLQIVIRKSLFSTLPTVGESVTVDSRALSISTIEHAFDGSILVLGCDDPTKGV